MPSALRQTPTWYEAVPTFLAIYRRLPHEELIFMLLTSSTKSVRSRSHLLIFKEINMSRLGFSVSRVGPPRDSFVSSSNLILLDKLSLLSLQSTKAMWEEELP